VASSESGVVERRKKPFSPIAVTSPSTPETLSPFSGERNAFPLISAIVTAATAEGRTQDRAERDARNLILMAGAENYMRRQAGFIGAGRYESSDRGDGVPLIV
jgi:hypothetical protein